MSTFADAITSGGNPSAGFSNANCSRGIGADYLATRLRRPDWQPISPCDGKRSCLDTFIDTPKPRKGKKPKPGRTKTATCPYCGKEFTYSTRDTQGQTLTYCPGADCRRDAERERKLEKWRAKYSAAARNATRP